MTSIRRCAWLNLVCFSTQLLLFSNICLNETFAQEDRIEIERTRQLLSSIKWERGPCTSTIAGVAEIHVPVGYQFTGVEGAAIWNEITQNPGKITHGVITPVVLSDWFLSFTFHDVGYVPDDDKTSLDADAILAEVWQSTEKVNNLRRQRGWSPIHVSGWIYPPAYDESTRALRWSLLATSDSGEQVANLNIRLLGRRGVVSATLVTNPTDMDSQVSTVNGLLTAFRFRAGDTYAEYRSGDQLAQYGLAGLITAGTTGLAAKTGLLAKLGVLLAKAGKAIYFALAMLAAGIWKLLSGRTGKRRKAIPR